MTSDTPDPATIVRTHREDHPPGVNCYWVGPRSAAAQWVARSRGGSVATDLGPVMALTQVASPQVMMLVGVARDGDWMAWLFPGLPPEPVPGSPGSTAAAN